jgi:hypothetical protein
MHAKKHLQARSTSTRCRLHINQYLQAKKIPHGFDSLGRSVAVTEKSHRVHRAAEKKRKSMAEKSGIYKRI